MRYIDLHVHSSASDGSFTPEEVVTLAREAGLCSFALTDHDTVDGVSEALAKAAQYDDIEVIPGTELSCYYQTREIHIVGLFVDHENRDFLEALRIMEQARYERNLRMVRNFVNAGIPMSIEELQNGNPKAVITRAHFAGQLIEKGVCKNKQEAFDRYLGVGCPFYLPKPQVTPEHVLSLIRNAGGTAILAHPYSYHFTKAQVEAMLDELIPLGLDGMECYYSTYDEGETSELRSIALHKHLLVSGGSDFHGAIKPDISIGTGWGSLRVPEKLLNEIRKHRQTNLPHE